MEAGASQRLRIALLLAASATTLCAALVLGAPAARSGSAALTELLPDLVVERPAELYLVGGGKRLRLRTSNTIANKGVGPLEITAGDAGDDCFLPGRPVGRHTIQVVYRDSSDPGSPGFFLRDEDTQQVLPPHEAGCSRYHPAHDHWHFDNFARYTLLSERTGRVVGRSRKVSFCVIDTGHPYPGLPGSPAGRRGYYPQDPLAPNPEFPSCSESSIDGLSIGWEDTYGASLPGQGLGIGKTRRGIYCLVLEADPATAELPAGALLERRERNNLRQVRLRILPRRGALRRLGAHCELPA